ncbi:putative cation-transporting ATPase 13A4 isoform X2 [Ascaphus truei]|uniref:putative cation-transporting ATPase 13A4 isoform X2 n=1 Tax=Ascaphus truei TaxID=8439 RepID=UPI003F5AC390
MIERSTMLNKDKENEMELFGYRTERWRHALCILGYICSLGFLLLLFYWKPEWAVWCHCVPCTLEEADVVLLRTTDEYKKYSKKKVKWIHPDWSCVTPGHEIYAAEEPVLNKLIRKSECKVRCIRVQKTRYIWNTADSMFQKIGVLDDKLSCSDIHTHYGGGLTRQEQEIRRQVCGPNAIEVKIVPIWKLLFKEVLNPLYFFNAYTLGTWFATGYIEYSMAIIILTLLSIGATIYNLRMQSMKLRNMVESHNNVIVTVLQKDGAIKEMESQYLVPGDVIILTGKKLYLPCDAILISGVCVLNESMLTGESIPVTKTPLPNVDNSVPWKIHIGENDRGHVLFCGTEIIKTKSRSDGPVKAVVLQTGFNTAKGDLVRSILYPKPVNFKLHRDAFRVIMGLVALSAIGVIYTVIVFSLNGASANELVLMSFIMATSAIPAALPAALTVGVLYAQIRLKKQGIFCISPQRISVCGQLNLICFDKTGTLTEDGLDLWGIVPSGDNSFTEVQRFSPGYTLSWSPLLGAMASCHSLVVLDGKIHGDPLDLKMFEGTGWELEECKTGWKSDGEISSCVIVKPGPSARMVPVKGICVLRQFPFSSGLQRMSVITQVLGGKDRIGFLKGAPEMVIHLCKPETVPFNFSITLDYYTMQGFRVIGLAYKLLESNEHLKIEQVTREEVESDLLFLGLLIMENRLKPETNPALQELNSANIRMVMLTGDNLQTACTVGLNSQMVPFASTLLVLEASDPEGDQPASIASHTMEGNRENGHKQDENSAANRALWSDNRRVDRYHYAMSGKSYETIVQHFPHLVPDILLNGTIFARMTPKQKSKIIEDFQKLDYFVGMCGDGANDCGALKMAHAGISLSQLEASVASPFTSKIPNIECVPKLLNACVPQDENRTMSHTMNLEPKESQNYLTTTLWPLSGINLIIVEFVFAKGRPFRQPIYTNYIFSILITLQLAAYLFILFADIEALYNSMELVCTPYYWRLDIFLMLVVLFVVSYSVEEGLIENRRLWEVIKKIFNYKSKSRYKELQRLLEKNPDCPLMKKSVYARHDYSTFGNEISV